MISSKRLQASAPIKEIVYELKDQLERRYGSQLKGVVLFGSYARGEETEGSDIDIAVILEDFDHACTEIERTGDLISLLSLKFDPRLTCPDKREGLAYEKNLIDLKYTARWRGTMNEEIEALLKMADKSIKGARILFEGGLYGFAVSRAYYAMFYLVTAVLLTKGLNFSKHKAVVATFGQHFIKTNIFDHKFHRYLVAAFEQRQIGDYEPLEEITEGTAEMNIERAVEFRCPYIS